MRWIPSIFWALDLWLNPLRSVELPPTSSERSGRSHCSSGRLLCRLITAPPTSPAGLPLPCLPLHQAPRTIRKCQFFIAAAEQRRWSRRVLWHSVWKKVRRRSWSLISSSSCSSSSRSSRSWSLISSSHQESVITDTPTLEAHHPAVTFFCWLRWKLLKLDFFLEWQFWFASITLFIHSWYVKQSFPIQIQNQT